LSYGPDLVTVLIRHSTRVKRRAQGSGRGACRSRALRRETGAVSVRARRCPRPASGRPVMPRDGEGFSAMQRENSASALTCVMAAKPVRNYNDHTLTGRPFAWICRQLSKVCSRGDLSPRFARRAWKHCGEL